MLVNIYASPIITTDYVYWLLAMRRIILYTAAILLTLNAIAQTEIGLSTGLNLTFPEAEIVSGSVNLKLDVYYPVSASERWVFGVWTHTELNHYLDLLIELQHRSPTFNLDVFEIGKRGVYLPITMQVKATERLHFDLGFAPYLHYREFIRYKGDFQSKKIEHLEPDLGFHVGLGYQLSDDWSVQAQYFKGNSVFHFEEGIQIGLTSNPASDIDVEVNISQVICTLSYRLF